MKLVKVLDVIVGELLSATTSIRSGLALRCLAVALLASIAYLPMAAAQTDPVPDQQEQQAQRSDLAADVDALKRDMEAVKSELARISASLERLQNQLAREQAEQSAAPPAALPVQQGQRPGPGHSQTQKNSVPAAAVPADTGTPTLFVFKDGSRTEAHNYAIVGETLWIYTDQEAKKYPVSTIDVGATKAANAERGTKFQLP